MDGTSPTLARLLEEADWLRKLALHLVRDPAAADDVVQETWIAALRQAPGGRSGPSRAWLATVARRLVGKRQRGETRRRAREDEVAGERRSTLEPSARDVTERLELQRTVAAAVAALPEPFRATLYQRYYEGLAPAEIAERADVPQGTVRWRAKRGRELLREELVRRGGNDWATWCAALAPVAGLPVPSIATTATATSFAAGLKPFFLWATGLAGVLVGLRLVVPLLAASDEPQAIEHASATLAPGPTAGADEIDGVNAANREANGRRVAEVGSAVTTRLDPTFGLVGHGRLLSSDGSVPGSGQLTLQDANGVEVRASVHRGGWLAFDLAPGRWTVRAALRGFRPLVDEVDVHVEEGTRWVHDFVLEPTVSVPVRVESIDGQEIADRWTRTGPGGLTVAVSEAALPNGIGRAPLREGDVGVWRARTTLDPLAHLPARYLGELELDGATPATATLLFGSLVLETRPLGPGTHELVFRVVEEELEAVLGSIRLRPVRADGSVIPAGDVARSTMARNDPRWRWARAVADGELVVLQGIPPGPAYVLIALGEEDLGLDVEVPAGGIRDLGDVVIGAAPGSEGDR